MDLLNRILSWLEQNLPNILLAFGIGYKEGVGDKIELEKKILDQETDNKLLENKIEEDKKYADISDRDIVSGIRSKIKK